ncbi:MAG: succinylglutamate desuccinylase/aspartoacylase family protein [Kiritimatiellae bacterium]|nr:succinylglutamate desuccinylase/aspartoacylase family protein [Kiritimatiellia bacterium]
MIEKTVLRNTFQSAGGRKVTVSVWRLQGKKPGPTLALVAGQHGMEHMGPVVLTRFPDCCPETFCGTVYLCACANPLALEIDYEWYPENEDLAKLNQYYYSRFNHAYCPFGIGRRTNYNMNRLWNRRHQPGYGVAGEIAGWIWDVACETADVIVDFHSRDGFRPLIFAADADVIPVARLFGAQGIYLSLAGIAADSFEGGNLAIQGNQDGKVAFCVEFSTQHGYRPDEIPFGINGILNVMKGMGMLPGEVVLDRPVYRILEKVPVAARAGGHIYYHCQPYDPVSKGDVLFDIRSPETLEIVDRGISPLDGIMSEPTYIPIAKSGLHLCAVQRADVVAEAGRPLNKPAIAVRKIAGRERRQFKAR